MNGDIPAIIAKGSLGAIPVIGPIISEVVGALIPNQRIDRVEQMLKNIERKIILFENKDIIINKFRENDKIAIFEEAITQATRTINNERINHLASIVKNSVVDIKYDYDRYQQVLKIINEISEVEVLILKYYSLPEYEDEWSEFRKKHEDIINKKPVHMQSQEEELLDSAYYDYNRNHLSRLNLLDIKYKTLKKNELPEFDQKTGTIKANGYKITRIGRELLRIIDEISLEGEE